MPPKRKTRLPSRATSTPSGDTAEHTKDDATIPSKLDPVRDHVVSDAWTDEQETSLFKGMIRWKPVGMHKHFRMIAVSQHLANHGYASPQNGHTRIPGIWEKLGSLYNLESLDAREDAIVGSISNNKNPAESYCPFALPEEDYWEMMFARRLASEDTSSPPSLPHQLSDEREAVVIRHSTVDDTDDPRSSPASIRGQLSGRNTRASKGTRTSQLLEASTAKARGVSKAADRGINNELREEDEGVDAVEEDENDSKRATSKDATPSAYKPSTAKNPKRRSGRRR